MSTLVRTIPMSNRQREAVTDLMFEFRLPNKSAVIREALCLMGCYRKHNEAQKWHVRSCEKSYSDRINVCLSIDMWKKLEDWRYVYRLTSVAAVVREAIELFILYAEREGTSIVPSANEAFVP